MVKKPIRVILSPSNDSQKPSEVELIHLDEEDTEVTTVPAVPQSTLTPTNTPSQTNIITPILAATSGSDCYILKVDGTQHTEAVSKQLSNFLPGPLAVSQGSETSSKLTSVQLSQVSNASQVNLDSRSCFSSTNSPAKTLIHPNSLLKRFEASTESSEPSLALNNHISPVITYSRLPHPSTASKVEKVFNNLSSDHELIELDSDESLPGDKNSLIHDVFYPKPVKAQSDPALFDILLKSKQSDHFLNLIDLVGYSCDLKKHAGSVDTETPTFIGDSQISKLYRPSSFKFEPDNNHLELFFHRNLNDSDNEIYNERQLYLNQQYEDCPKGNTL